MEFYCYQPLAFFLACLSRIQYNIVCSYTVNWNAIKFTHLCAMNSRMRFPRFITRTDAIKNYCKSMQYVWQINAIIYYLLQYDAMIIAYVCDNCCIALRCDDHRIIMQYIIHFSIALKCNTFKYCFKMQYILVLL